VTERPFPTALARYATATEPPDAVRQRVLARIDAEVGAAGSITADLGVPADPTAAARARVRREVARSRQALETPWRPSLVGGARPHPAWRTPAFAAAGLAAVSIALLWGVKSEPPRVDPVVPIAVVQPPGVLVPLDVTADESTAFSPTPGVTLISAGKGTVAGTSTAPVVAWRRGRLDVEVEPHRGIGLVVQTDEGDIRVVGTSFTVERDLLGTHVTVHHGRVIVACRGAADLALKADDQATCLPITPAGLLGRARTLAQTGAPVSEILQAANTGLAAGGANNAIGGELLYLRMKTLERAGLDDEARRTAAEYVTSGQTPRRDEALRLAGAPR
jgi:hypothetical protein